MEGEQQPPRISVVIPAHNEAENLQYVLPCIPSIVSEVILVDGHSTDDTSAIARQMLPTIRIVRQTGKGKGGALREGFAALLSGHSASIATTLYIRARTPVWQLIRRSSASVTRYLQERLPVG